MKFIFCYFVLLFPYTLMDKEFKPLFDGGIHDIQLRDMRDKFSTPFSNNAKRNTLIEKFEIFLYRVKELELDFEIWIDGSFTTEKEEPNDIDAVVFLDKLAVEGLSSDKIYILNELANIPLVKSKYNCDVRFSMNGDAEGRSYWRGWFGFSRTEKAKGIARIIC